MKAINNITTATQVIPKSKVVPCEQVQELDKKIDGLYASWNHYDILPDVCDLLRRKSDAVAPQCLVRESIAALSRAIIFDPLSGVNFSMRGRRYINASEFEQACADFAMASRLISENWYVWYHLGLCNLILGHYDLAEKAYNQCAFIPTTPSLTIALLNWRWIVLMRQGRKEEAAALIADVDTSTAMDGTDNYMRLIMLYKGLITPEQAMEIPEDDESPILSVTTQGFGVANYYRVTGDMENYKKTLERTIEVGKDEAWMCFGYAAAEYELARIKG